MNESLKRQNLYIQDASYENVYDSKLSHSTARYIMEYSYDMYYLFDFHPVYSSHQKKIISNNDKTRMKDEHDHSSHTPYTYLGIENRMFYLKNQSISTTVSKEVAVMGYSLLMDLISSSTGKPVRKAWTKL